jgi:hypothetical protein
MRYKGKSLFGKDFSIDDFRARFSLAMAWLAHFTGTGKELSDLLADEEAFENTIAAWKASHPLQKEFVFGKPFGKWK